MQFVNRGDMLIRYFLYDRIIEMTFLGKLDPFFLGTSFRTKNQQLQFNNWPWESTYIYVVGIRRLQTMCTVVLPTSIFGIVPLHRQSFSISSLPYIMTIVVWVSNLIKFQWITHQANFLAIVNTCNARQCKYYWHHDIHKFGHQTIRSSKIIMIFGLKSKMLLTIDSFKIQKVQVTTSTGSWAIGLRSSSWNIIRKST